MKSIGEFFSELTDLDKGFFSTIVTLFRNPKKVVDAYLFDTAVYTKPLRCALINASAYSFLSYLYERFFNAPPVFRVWSIPLRTIEYSQNISDFRTSFDPFIMLFTIVPLAMVILKILFRKKPWLEISVIALYAFAQYWVVMLLFVPVPAFPYADLFEPLVALIVTFLCFRNVLQGGLARSLSKWMALSFLILLWVNYIINPLVNYEYNRVMFKETPIPIIKPDEVSPLSQRSLAVGSWYKSVKGDAEHKVVQFTLNESGMNFKCFDKTLNSRWELFISKLSGFRSIRSISLDSQTYGFLVIGEERNSKEINPVLFILSNQGLILNRKIYKPKTILNEGIIVKQNTLLVVGGKEREDKTVVPFIDVIDFEYAHDSIIIKTEKTHELADAGKRFRNVFNLGHSANKLRLLLSVYENAAGGVKTARETEISEVSLIEVEIDSAIQVKWKNVIFKKSGKYSPFIDNIITKLDTVNNRIFACYSLANDELLTASLYCISLNGETLWEKELVEDNNTYLTNLIPDNSKLYFSGRISTDVPKHPLVSRYGLGIVGSVSMEGKNAKVIKYGKFKPYSYDEFYDMVLNDSTLDLFHVHTGYQLGSTLFNKERDLSIMTFRKDDL